jgi:cytochrome c5
MKNLKRHTLLFLFPLALLAACSEDTSNNFTNITWQAQNLSPELERIYQSSCKNCHEVEGTGAPLTGDSKNWNKVLEKGLTASVENAINGFGGMPPGGQCFECTPEHMMSLIQYMSKPENNNQ